MSARLWPFVPVLLLVLCVAGQAILYVAAKSSRGLAVEPNYYEKAVRWDERHRAPAPAPAPPEKRR